MFLCSSYIVIILNILSRIGNHLGRESNLQKFGTLYSDTNYNSFEKRQKLSHYDIIVFLLRRYLYVFIILFLFRYPILQQITNISLHFLTFLYDIVIRPFPLGVLGILIYFFDFILMAIFGSLPLYMVFPEKAEQIGRIHIYILIATIVLSWIIIIIMNAKTVYLKIKEAKKKKKKRINNSSTMINNYLKNKITVNELAKITGQRTDFRKTEGKTVTFTLSRKV